jgi:hypothetical protein
MRRSITLAVGLLCLASEYAVARNATDTSEVDPLTGGDGARGAP